MSVSGKEHRELVEALVGERWRGLYLNSASFHAAIETLARMLPMWVDGMGERMRREDELWLAEVTAMKFDTTPPRRLHD